MINGKFEVLTLLTRPLIVFFNASQAIRWYSADDLSVRDACKSRSLAGGMYKPPVRTGALGAALAAGGSVVVCFDRTSPSSISILSLRCSSSLSDCEPDDDDDDEDDGVEENQMMNVDETMSMDQTLVLLVISTF